MAEQTISLRDNQQAVVHYKEAMKVSQGDHVIMAAYARLCMQVSRWPFGVLVYIIAS